jgi:malate dehydrogenase
MPLVAEADVRAAVAAGRDTLVVDVGTVVTPQALDLAERHAMRIVHEPATRPTQPGIDPARAISRVLLRRSPRWVAPPPRRGAHPTRFGRVAFVGSGMVGATAAHLTALGGMADELTLVDVVPGIAAGTALDIEHASGITGSPTRARGSTSLDLVAGADVVVVTAGRPRTPGMTRAGLATVNGRVVRDVADAVAAHAPHAVVVVVTNPVDEMTHEMWRSSGLPDRQVLGMAGTLDASRFRDALAAAAGVRPADVWATALGSHGAEMVPIVSSATIKGRPARSVLSGEQIARCVQTAVDGGASVVALRRTGSAFIAPAHAVVEILDAIRGATTEALPVSTRARGTYGIDGVFLGLRAELDRGGVGGVVEDRLDEAELAALRAAAAAISARLAANSGVAAG